MRRRYKMFGVRVPKMDGVELGERLCARRLERIRSELADGHPVAEWLHAATAKWLFGRTGEGDTISAMLDQPTEEDYPHYPSRLSSAERDRIKAWAKRWSRRSGAGVYLSAKIPKDERDEVATAASGMCAVHHSEGRIDEIFSDVHHRFPWLSHLTETAWRQAVRRSRSGLPAGIGAMVVVGPPGTGKSSWARAVGDGLGVPSVCVDAGATGGVHEIQGVARGWGSADRGRIVATALSSRTANPVVIIDELDVGSRTVGSTRGSLPGLHAAMLGMIEPSTARAWVCPYYQVPVDLRNVSWICTSNSLNGIARPLLDRMTIVRIGHLSRDQILAFASREADDRFGPDFAYEVVDRMRRDMKTGANWSLRDVGKMMDGLSEAMSRPILH
ncbi:AAA family ATPase [Sulfitobacter guttiformis]|uniref:ATPase family protein associated with various cellular activities (AAA) n=1 Tax=Sulfitobacter guttiformis TaxID=74349 RepID=A0A420DH84_9RHOB|nr:AAA family ATPase [Sulfitobacter guttiformis]KIN72688.1 AAA ATPase [Sulfitobacter guttiformis KCTC 32187]RKE93585.1 ATPase family protein associated with various cellular activities (AAA) [Sulfitobacter guttiformis]